MRARTLVLIAFAQSFFPSVETSAGDWARFRGPNGSGINVDGHAVPTGWNATTNLRWTMELPGPGHSSPIVVGDHVFLTCWTGYGIDSNDPGDQKDLRLHLLCVNRNDGAMVWSKEIMPELPLETSDGKVTEHDYASHTPVSDGESIFVYFGKTGVLAFDMKGEKLWQTKVGDQLESARGGGSASGLILYQNLVIVTATEAGELVALDKQSGKEVWNHKDKVLSNTYGTPALVTTQDARTDLVLSVPYAVWGMDPDTGERRWSCEGSQDKTVHSSVIAQDDVVYAIGGRGGGTIAVRAGGKGDVTTTHGLWESGRSGLTASPIYYEGRVYWISDDTAYCLDATTGKVVYRTRLAKTTRKGPAKVDVGSTLGADYATAVACNDKMYQLKRNGEMVVVLLGLELKAYASSWFEGGGDFFATPAISQGALFVRSTKHLYCVEKASD